MAVTHDLEAAKALGDAILQALDLAVLELEDEAAAGADEVVVVVAGDLVARLAVAELARVRSSSIET